MQHVVNDKRNKLKGFAEELLTFFEMFPTQKRVVKMVFKLSC